MTNQNQQAQNTSLTFSMLISETVLKAVVGVERLIELVRK